MSILPTTTRDLFKIYSNEINRLITESKKGLPSDDPRFKLSSSDIHTLHEQYLADDNSCEDGLIPALDMFAKYLAEYTKKYVLNSQILPTINVLLAKFVDDAAHKKAVILLGEAIKVQAREYQVYDASSYHQ